MLTTIQPERQSVKLTEVRGYSITAELTLLSVATNHPTLKNESVFFRSKPALQRHPAQCASSVDAQVPRARLSHYSLITPSSEILVDHYFLRDCEIMLMTLEISIHYKMLLRSEGFYSLVLFLLAALWRWAKLPAPWNS